MIRFLASALFSFGLSTAALAGEAALFDMRIQATCYAYDSQGEHLDGYCGEKRSSTLFEGRIEATFEPIDGDANFMLAERHQRITAELPSGESVSLTAYVGLLKTAKELDRPLSLSANVQQTNVDSSDALTLKLKSLRSFEGLIFPGPRFAQSLAGGIIVKHFLTVNLTKISTGKRQAGQST